MEENVEEKVGILQHICGNEMFNQKIKKKK